MLKRLREGPLFCCATFVIPKAATFAIEESAVSLAAWLLHADSRFFHPRCARCRNDK